MVASPEFDLLEIMSQVDEVRAAADIATVVGDYVKLRKAGANLMGLCPFHQEKTPSFAVHPAKQIFHCFGCGAGGDVFKFVMLIENLSFPEALERIAERVGIRLHQNIHAPDDPKTQERAALFQIHAVAAKFYESQLTGTVEGRAARAYLIDRGVSEQTISRFRLGYAPRDGRALARELGAAGFAPALLEKSGLILPEGSEQSHRDRFRGRIIYPIANESGKIVAFGGRALGDEQPKYLNSPETPIYTKGRVLYHLDQAGKGIRKQDYAILVEGYMDCIAVDSCGIDNVVASCGTSLTENQIRLLTRFSRRVVVNYDPDSAGVAATERSLDALLEAGFEVKVLALAGGLDPDSFIRKHGATEYRRVLTAASGYIDYITDRAITKHGLSTAQGKMAAVNAVLPYLARVPNPILRSELTGRIAARLLLDDRLLRDELKRAAVQRRPEIRPQRTLSATPAERKLLRAFLENGELIDELLPGLITDGLLDGMATKGLLERLLELRAAGKYVDIHQLGESLRPEERQLVHESLVAGGEAPGREDVLKYCAALRWRKIKRELEQLLPAIDAAGREQDWARLVKLNESKVLLLKELAKVKEN